MFYENENDESYCVCREHIPLNMYKYTNEAALKVYGIQTKYEF